jgi:hypothetical protein
MSFEQKYHMNNKIINTDQYVDPLNISYEIKQVLEAPTLYYRNKTNSE